MPSFLIYIPIWFYFNIASVLLFLLLLTFTFQYGSTLIKVNFLSSLFISQFTFQYGSTLIVKATIEVPKRVQIYIPIWFYFNKRFDRNKYNI